MKDVAQEVPDVAVAKRLLESESSTGGSGRRGREKVACKVVTRVHGNALTRKRYNKIVLNSTPLAVDLP